MHARRLARFFLGVRDEDDAAREPDLGRGVHEGGEADVAEVPPRGVAALAQDATGAALVGRVDERRVRREAEVRVHAREREVGPPPTDLRALKRGGDLRGRGLEGDAVAARVSPRHRTHARAAGGPRARTPRGETASNRERAVSAAGRGRRARVVFVGGRAMRQSRWVRCARVQILPVFARDFRAPRWPNRRFDVPRARRRPKAHRDRVALPRTHLGAPSRLALAGSSPPPVRRAGTGPSPRRASRVRSPGRHINISSGSLRADLVVRAPTSAPASRPTPGRAFG